MLFVARVAEVAVTALFAAALELPLLVRCLGEMNFQISSWVPRSRS